MGSGKRINFIICNINLIWSDDGQGMQPEQKKIGVLSKYEKVNLQEGDNYEDLGVNRTSIRIDLKEIGVNKKII